MTAADAISALMDAFSDRKAVLTHLRDEQARNGASPKLQSQTAAQIDELSTALALSINAIRRTA